MQSNAHVPRRNGGRRIVCRASDAVLLSALGLLGGCRGAETNIIAPESPKLAVYANGIWLVNSLADPGDGQCTSNECTLREAIAAANVGDRITFKSNLSGTILLTSGTLLLQKHVTIKGLGYDLITVSGGGATTVFEVGGQNPVSAFLTDITVTGGVSTGSGGGIIVSPGSSLRLTRTTVRDNRAVLGGGISNSGTLTLVESTISDNAATEYGGGIRNGAVLTIESSTISRNVAGIGGGGIVDFCVPLVCDVGPRIWNTTITGNSVTTLNAQGGGGVLTFLAATTANTIIAGNLTNGSVAGPDANCWGVVSSLGHSLTSLGGGCLFTDASDVVVTAALIFTSVLDPVLADHGGPTKTHALVERGYAVDAGYCPGANADQRGLPRPYDDPAMPNALEACDIGSFEWEPAGKAKDPKP